MAYEGDVKCFPEGDENDEKCCVDEAKHTTCEVCEEYVLWTESYEICYMCDDYGFCCEPNGDCCCLDVDCELHYPEL